jgi:hypothetical protein
LGGLFKLLEREPVGITKDRFKAVRKFRGGLLHGGSSLSEESVEAIKGKELKSLRALAVIALATVLRVPSDIVERIASKTVHRVVVPTTTKLSGDLALLTEVPQIEAIGMQPEFSRSYGLDKFSLTADGSVNVTGNQQIKCNGANYRLGPLQLWRDENAGATASAAVDIQKSGH